MVVDIYEYVSEEMYKGRIIRVNIADANYKGNRITKLYCPGYSENVISLNNATDIQIEHQIENFFSIAREKIDENSIVNKVKRLFK